MSAADQAELDKWVQSGRTASNVYRGITLSDTKWDQQLVTPGHELTVGRSWSADPTRTAAYGAGGAHSIRYTLPAGAVGRDISEHSLYPEERETFIPPGTRLRVASAEYNRATTIWEVTLEAVPGAHLPTPEPAAARFEVSRRRHR